MHHVHYKYDTVETFWGQIGESHLVNITPKLHPTLKCVLDQIVNGEVE